MVVHVWSMFAVVFLATYTANLAVFMITREESHKFEGIHDPREKVELLAQHIRKVGTEEISDSLESSAQWFNSPPTYEVVCYKCDESLEFMG
ncbi:unnamed protein product [Allacma fusca]|uniref:Ionotropic glutamate receptor C-terminal domain-containing protein n=1 Tax=Allacma fusca TaxID=39272 RepID=A0A8J2JJ79_9HEXA|nr:unnamed protein product [Allacma fusca]